ncbi:MAG TPA: signal peptidase I [Leptospiraceae bacterium]|nr:signal peptidase I [Leptospiraceae bacterium]
MKSFLKKLSFYLLLVLLIFLARTFVIQLYIVNGNSMLPTLKTGALLLTSKYQFSQRMPFTHQEFIYGNPKISRLDMVLFEGEEGDILIKRAIGLPGDFYNFMDGRILIDSVPLDEQYKLQESKTLLMPQSLAPDSIFFPMQREGRIPPDYFLLLGDNREHSYDSRNIGLVPVSRLRGKVLFILKK